ncbi:DNA repair protein RAD51 homolog 4 isoform X1 [Kryptolebias marmoratus]|uniref:DNA repair protein RAD51 homolog 4 n=1 Tax=Kryptolebias marmoratus TaxID=37003 RepID=A0A3Q3AMP6_KRYMA|nr:DNA repair protein RAD51 homolog 4 isoform X1 [Kryptolebias marmoratus]XP_037835057.1 DNA repair protein RAD51 homolog 4 isoform X1 [Kryptolebias marmoratus]
MVILREGMCPGLDEDLLRSLRAADIRTVEDLVSSDSEELAQKCSVSYKALFAIRRVLLAQHTAFPVSGADLYEELLSSTAILSTGNPSLDKLLDSGLFTGEITELSGGPGSGKSQVCFGAAVHISHHLKQSVIYIDTTGGLTASRLLQMLRSETTNTDEQMEALQRIRIVRLFDVYALLDCLYGLCGGGLQQASVGGGSVKAVIVDSVSAVIAPLLGGKQSEGMSLMTQVAGVLKTMAKDFSVAALVTNHVTRSGSGDVQPGLGVSWSHVPRTRILLERVETAPSVSRSSLRSATLIKSSRQPCCIKEEFDLRWWSGAAGGASGKRKLDQAGS